MRPAINDYLQLPEGEYVINSLAYRVDHKKFPKWKFWRNEVVQYNVMVTTNHGRIFLINPAEFTLEEKTGAIQ